VSKALKKSFFYSLDNIIFLDLGDYKKKSKKKSKKKKQKKKGKKNKKKDKSNHQKKHWSIFLELT